MCRENEFLSRRNSISHDKKRPKTNYGFLTLLFGCTMIKAPKEFG